MGVIETHNLVFKYGNDLVFNGLNLNIKQGSFTTIIGNNGSGKSTLLKLLLGFEKSQGIYVFNKPLEDNLWLVRRKVATIFEHPETMFVEDTVEEEIDLALRAQNLDKKTRQKRIRSVAKQLEITHLLQCNPFFLTEENKCLVAFAICLVTDPEIIIIDDMLNVLNSDLVINILKKLNKQGLTIINLTTNPEEIFYGKNVIFIDKGKNIFSGTIRKLMNHLDVFEKCKIDLPFLLDLSNKLMFYDLIDKNYINMEKLVNDLWKN